VIVYLWERDDGSRRYGVWAGETGMGSLEIHSASKPQREQRNEHGHDVYFDTPLFAPGANCSPASTIACLCASSCAPKHHHHQLITNLTQNKTTLRHVNKNRINPVFQLQQPNIRRGQMQSTQTTQIPNQKRPLKGTKRPEFFATPKKKCKKASQPPPLTRLFSQANPVKGGKKNAK